MNNDRDLYLVSVFTFITVLTWIFFEWVKTDITSTITSEQTVLMKPLDPKIDTRTLSTLEKRQQY